MAAVRHRLIGALMLLQLAAFARTGRANEPQSSSSRTGLQIGAIAVNVTPVQYPVIVNGMFEERTADRDVDPLFARAFVLDDGKAAHRHRRCR